jgi:hypothetical protein
VNWISVKATDFVRLEKLRDLVFFDPGASLILPDPDARESAGIRMGACERVFLRKTG